MSYIHKLLGSLFQYVRCDTGSVRRVQSGDNRGCVHGGVGSPREERPQTRERGGQHVAQSAGLGA